MAQRQEGPGAPPDGVVRPTLAGNDLLSAADWPWELGADGALSFLSLEFEASTAVSTQSLLGRELCQNAADGPSVAARCHRRRQGVLRSGAADPSRRSRRGGIAGTAICPGQAGP